MELDPIQHQVCYLSLSAFKRHINSLAVVLLLLSIVLNIFSKLVNI